LIWRVGIEMISDGNGDVDFFGMVKHKLSGTFNDNVPGKVEF
jgi:hypothetical protein